MLHARVKTCVVAFLALGVVSTGAGLSTNKAPAEGGENERPKTASLTDASYAALRDQVRPNASELAWQKIPWRASVWDGIVEGQQKDKPILIWMLNGHPLACT
jgi:hypothetical protein